jgi:hypothetical protein
VHFLCFTLLLPVDTPLGHRYAVSFRNLPKNDFALLVLAEHAPW